VRQIVSYLVFCAAVGAALTVFLPTLVLWYAAIAVVGGLLLFLDQAKGSGPREPSGLSRRMPADPRQRAVADPERVAAEAVEAKRDRTWDVPHPTPPTTMVLKAADGRTVFGLNGCQTLNLLIILENSSPERWWKLLCAHVAAQGNPSYESFTKALQRAGECGLAARGGFPRADVLEAERMAYEAASKLRPLIIDQVVAHSGINRASAEETLGGNLRDLAAMLTALVMFRPWLAPGEFELFWGPYESALPVEGLGVN
jgi:hypothetical protein